MTLSLTLFTSLFTFSGEDTTILILFFIRIWNRSTTWYTSLLVWTNYGNIFWGLGYLPGGHLPPPKFGHLPPPNSDISHPQKKTFARRTTATPIFFLLFLVLFSWLFRLTAHGRHQGWEGKGAWRGGHEAHQVGGGRHGGHGGRYRGGEVGWTDCPKLSDHAYIHTCWAVLLTAVVPLTVTISCNIECELCLFRQSDRAKLPWAWYLKTKLLSISHFNTNFLSNRIFKLSYSIPAKDWVERKPWWAREAAH